MKSLQDEAGKRYGRLFVIGRTESKKRTAWWNCRCDCGTELSIRGNSLRSGSTTSCGCYRKEKCGRKVVELLGNRFGRLYVTAKGPIKNRVQYWSCRCDCGALLDVRSNSLRQGNTSSCGCARRKERLVACDVVNCRHGDEPYPSILIATYRTICSEERAPKASKRIVGDNISSRFITQSNSDTSGEPSFSDQAHWAVQTQADVESVTSKKHNHSAVGIRNNRATQTDDSVRAIRAAAANGEDLKAIARRFGIGFHGVWDIVKRRSWKHVE